MSSKGKRTKGPAAATRRAVGNEPAKAPATTTQDPIVDETPSNVSNLKNQQTSKQNLARQRKNDSDKANKFASDDDDEDKQLSVEELLTPGGSWFRFYQHLPALDPAKTNTRAPPTKQAILAKKEHAEKLYDEIAKNVESGKKARGSDEAWMQTVIKSGTTSDKMAAMTLSIQAAPLHRLRSLETLVQLAAKKGRREAMMAIDTLKDLFLNNLLPGDRKLIPFHKRPVDHPDAQDVHFIYWYFEDIVKDLYADFMGILENWSRDSVFHAKKKTQDVAQELLLEKPEGEQRLLELLITKMGDNENKIASNSVYLLTLLLERHPAMKLSVVKEVETYLHRPHISLRAQYYAVIFLNQVILNRQSVDVSKKLLDIYFSLFKRLVSVENNIESRMLSGLLTGVNRTFPFAPSQPEQFDAQMDTLFRVVHIASFNKSVQALLLIFQVMFAQKNVSDRFYRALYTKLMSPEIFHSTRVGLFLNVLFKAMKNDTDPLRVKAFLKRLLQVSLYQHPTFACGALFLVSEILRSKPSLRASLVEHAEPVSELERHLSKRALELLQDPSLKTAQSAESDDDDEAENDAPATSPSKPKKQKKDMIYFAGKPRLTAKPTKESTKKSKQQQQPDPIQLNLKTVALTPAVASAEEEDAEVQQPSSNNNMDVDLTPEQIKARVAAFDIKTTPLQHYDGMHRDPKYCHADCCSCWELSLLSQHFHPSVSLWALHILAGHPIEYSGDPLRDMSVQAFLDRFMYKNPKISGKKKTEAAATSKSARKLMRSYEPPTERAHAVNTPEFMQKASKNGVAPDEVFFYKFFKQKDELHPKQAEDRKRRGGEDEDDFDSEFSSVSEDEAERAVLEGLEDIEGSKIYDRKAMKEAEKEEWSYDDMDESDFDEGSSVEEEEEGRKSKKPSAKDFDDDDIFGNISDGDDEDAPQLGDEDDMDDMDDMDEQNFSDDDAFNEMLAEEADLDGVGYDSDEEDAMEDMEADADSDDDAKGGKKKKKKSKFSRSTFASLDEFQELLDKSGFGDEPEKNRKWEEKRINNTQRANSGGNSGGGFNKRKRPGSDRPSNQPNKRRKRN